MEMTQQLEDLLDEQIDLEHGLDFLLSQGMPQTDPNVQYHIERLAQVNNEIESLTRPLERRKTEKKKKESPQDTTAVKKMDGVKGLACFMAAVDLKDSSIKQNSAAGAAAKLKKTSAAKKQSAATDSTSVGDLKQASTKHVTKDACAFCGDSSKSPMDCAACLTVCYCSQRCQKQDWKSHKAFCKAKQKERAPITWSQLESYNGIPAHGKVLEVTFVQQEPGLRLVARCRDSAGDYRRVAAYTNSRNIANFVAGTTLRWKNPRYYYFLDGSSGARIENDDLDDIEIL